jgi:ABC-type Zn uptake system ZnuABC Zn-binding protein ZnuA
LVLFPSPALAQPPIQVVVTLPVLKDFVEQVGGDHVLVHSMLTGLESEHTYTPRPSDIRVIQKAKLFVSIGLGLDGWIEPLIKNADADLYRVVASESVPLIPYHNSSGRVDVRAAHLGDPHIWLDPRNAMIMIHSITEGLVQIDPSHHKTYRQNEAKFIGQLEQRTLALKVTISALPNQARKIITHHQGWSYFARQFGFEIAGEILTHVETEGGADPSAKRMGELVRLMRRKKVGVIVSEPQYNPKMPETLAEETGARLVFLSLMPGTSSKTETYLALIRYNVETLVRALQKR